MGAHPTSRNKGGKMLKEGHIPELPVENPLAQCSKTYRKPQLEEEHGFLTTCINSIINISKFIVLSCSFWTLFFTFGENEHLKLTLHVRNLNLVDINSGVQWFLVFPSLPAWFSLLRDAGDNKCKSWDTKPNGFSSGRGSPVTSDQTGSTKVFWERWWDCPSQSHSAHTEEKNPRI